MLKTGAKAPTIELLDQFEKDFSLQKYVKRDVASSIGRTVIVGISPDAPAKLRKFDEKFELGFALLSDVDHVVAKAFKVWKKKSMYGREYMGIERSAFLIDQGVITHAWYKISPKDTPLRLLEALGK